MTSRLTGVLLLALGCLAGAGCASVDELTRDLPGVKPLKYTLARADHEQGASLARGQTQLRAGEYAAAVRSLRQALWEVEKIDKLWLRLEELAGVHRALAKAYSGLGKTPWGEEHWALADALEAYARRDGSSVAPDVTLAKAKAAYQAAHFRQAVAGLNQALVELEGLSPTPVRLRALGEARCHLVLAYFALDQEERAAEVVRQLAARDGATAACRLLAPPPVRALIRDVEVSEARVSKPNAD